MKPAQLVPRDTLEKSVSALAMIPKSNSITRVGRQAYTVMMLIAREQSRDKGDSEIFSTPLNSVVKGFDGAAGTVGELKRHLKSMVTHLVEWQSPSPAETIEWDACALLAHVKLHTKNGETWIDWSYAANLRQEMLSPQRYAQLRRSTIAQFRTHAGLALYEICARYKDNPSHTTSKQHWHWWLPVLTGKPVPMEIKTEFRFFNRDTIKPAVEEVNEVSELIVTAHEIKVGRSIEFVQFEVHKKTETQTVAPEALDLTEVVRAQKLGIDSDLAEDLFIRYGALLFAKALDRLASRLLMQGTPVFSKHAYLKALLSGRVIDKVQDTPTDAGSGGEEGYKPSVPYVNEALKRQDRFRENESERVKLVRAEIEALPEEELAALLAGLKVQFRLKAMSQSIMQRLEDGKWQSALVLGELIRFYWKQTRGTEWMAAEELPKVERIEQAGLF